jgi:hypothetical protein
MNVLQGWQGWLAEMLDGSQGRKLVKSEQFYSIPSINGWAAHQSNPKIR